MKRRNADCGKLRRPLKRTKITEGIYGSTFVYLKFLMVWALVLLADFMLEFRFEYLWPFWLLLRSVYDSFKYQGLAFSVFFICVAVTSDVICYLFIPVQWLFFCASTYVWVQYVWHTERGICLPTVSLWLLFVYIEATIRLREIKTFPFNMDLCRPFAAHCIGYPVVTLGFGFKSYISYRFRLRKQKDVEKENEFYIHLLQQALPIELQIQEKQKALPTSTSKEEVISPATTNTTHQNGSVPGKQDKKSSTVAHKNDSNTHTCSSEKDKDLSNSSSSNLNSSKQNKQNNNSTPSHIEDFEYIENNLPKRHNVNDYEEENLENERHSAKLYNNKQHNGVAGGGGKNHNHHHHHHHQQSSKNNSQNNSSSTNLGTNTANATTHTSSKKGKNTTVYLNNKDEVIARLESDIKKLKTDLQCSRNTEQEMRSQISSLTVNDKSVKSELFQLQQDNESLQTKLHNLVTSRQQDKQNLSALEKKLQDERKGKVTLEQQLASERKAKKEEAAKALASANRMECTDVCKNRRRDLENEIKQSRRESMLWEDQTRQLERETQTLRQYKEAQNDTEVLMSALAAMQDKNTHLENSLSAENRLKQDLFSALGEAKRQIEIHQALLARRDMEVAELKGKIAEVISVMPVVLTNPANNNTPLHLSGNFTPPPGSFTPPQCSSASTPPPPSPSGSGEEMVANSSLNPNASDYTPKMSQ